MKTDSVFYRLFQRLPSLVLDLAEIEVADAGGYQFRSEEIKQTAFRLDGVMRPPKGSELPLIFVEVQYQRDPNFYRRFFAEIFLHLAQGILPSSWRAVVFYPTSVVEVIAPAYAPLLTLSWVRRVYLNEVAQQPVTSRGRQLLQILLAEETQAAAQARDLAQQLRVDEPDQWRDWVDLVETLLIYRIPRLSREEIRIMLNIWNTELKDTRFYQEVFAEGRQDENARLVLRQLRRRFGEAAALREPRLRRLSLEQGEALAEALLDFQSMADLDNWLAGVEQAR